MSMMPLVAVDNAFSFSPLTGTLIESLSYVLNEVKMIFLNLIVLGFLSQCIVELYQILSLHVEMII